MIEVERVHGELVLIESIIAQSGDMSAATAFASHSAKVLLLTGASYFERAIIGAIEQHVHSGTSSPLVKHFTLHQSVERKFFALFDFSADTKNINGFLSKFGPDFSQWAKEDLKTSGVSADIQLAFLDLCRLRNSLVHNNYATFDINKTLSEVRSDFDKAMKLVTWIESAFTRFQAQTGPTEPAAS